MCLDPHLDLGWGLGCETGLSPPVKYFYWPFQSKKECKDHELIQSSTPNPGYQWESDNVRQYFFFGSFVLFMSCVCHAFASVHCCLVVTCWERADLLALVCYV